MPSASFDSVDGFPRWYSIAAKAEDIVGDVAISTDVANRVCETADALVRNDQYRRAKWIGALSYYEGRSVNLDSDCYFSEAETTGLPTLPPLYNLIRSACDTAQADIAGRQKPKPMFLTTGADWRTRRKAKKLDKFVEAQLSERQGQYEDAWRLMLDVFHDATKGDGGLAKVWGDADKKKIRIERVLPWEIHVDEREARYGDPQNLFHVYDMERDLAISTFASTGDSAYDDRVRIAIQSARQSRATTNRRIAQTICIREAWHLPFDDENPGLHVIAIENCTLSARAWKRPRFPFVKILWGRATVGWWGVGIAAEGETQQLAVNDTSERLSERMRICSTRVTFYNGAVVKRSDLEEGGEAEVLIECQDMTQVPQTAPINPASPQEFQWLGQSIQRFYETLGISQLSASSQKPPGVNAAVAMQTLNDIQTVRFLPKARGYEVAFEELGQLCVDAACDIADEGGGYLVKWPGKRFLEELDWKEVNMAEDMYRIRVSSVSQFSRDPAAILELAQEFRDRGDISRETYLQMVGLPDFEELLNRETAESEWVRDLMERFLDCLDQSELDKAGGFETPEPFIANIPGAVAICVATYWEAKRDRAPEFCLQNIRKFIVELQSLVQQLPQPAQQAAAAQQQASGMLAQGAQVQSLAAGATPLGAPGMPPPPAPAMPG